MRTQIFLISVTMVLCGCFAVVSEEPKFKQVRSFILTDDEALFILDEAENTSPAEKYEVFPLKRQK